MREKKNEHVSLEVKFCATSQIHTEQMMHRPTIGGLCTDTVHFDSFLKT